MDRNPLERGFTVLNTLFNPSMKALVIRCFQWVKMPAMCFSTEPANFSISVNSAPKRLDPIRAHRHQALSRLLAWSTVVNW